MRANGANMRTSWYLQRPAQLHRVALLDHGDAEVGGLKQLFEDGAVGLVFCS